MHINITWNGIPNLDIAIWAYLFYVITNVDIPEKKERFANTNENYNFKWRKMTIYD